MRLFHPVFLVNFRRHFLGIIDSRLAFSNSRIRPFANLFINFEVGTVDIIKQWVSIHKTTLFHFFRLDLAQWLVRYLIDIFFTATYSQTADPNSTYKCLRFQIFTNIHNTTAITINVISLFLFHVSTTVPILFASHDLVYV